MHAVVKSMNPRTFTEVIIHNYGIGIVFYWSQQWNKVCVGLVTTVPTVAV